MYYILKQDNKKVSFKNYKLRCYNCKLINHLKFSEININEWGLNLDYIVHETLYQL